MRRRGNLFLLCVVGTGIWLIATAAWVVWKSRGGKPGHEIAIWLTGDIRGRLVPCGCFTGQLGGLTRIATLVKTKPPDASLKVDIGDALEGTADYERIKLGYIHRAFGQLAYDAANLGHREAALTVQQLRDLAAASPVPLLGANLVDAATGQPVAKPSVIVTKGGWRIAIVGIMDARIAPEDLGRGLRIDAPANSLARLLPSLKSQSDFRVLLAFTDQAGLYALAREFPEFDLILGGRVTQPAQKLEHEGRTPILYVTNESRAVGSLHATLNAGSLAVDAAEVLLVHDRITESGAIAALAKSYRDQIRNVRLDIDDPSRTGGDFIPGVRTTPAFAGTDACAKCHPGAHRIWRESGHARAFATLRNAGADADPNCLACHTVGFGTPAGYRREFAGSKLVDVGCESCHGPGSRHIESRTAGNAEAGRLRPLGAGDCQRCHHGEFSRPFDWNDFWPVVKHAREATAP